MYRSMAALCLTGALMGCSPTTGQQVAATVAGAVVGIGPIGSTGPRGTEKLPDTPQCREYERYARISGAPGTMSPLIKKYNACLNSAPRSAAAKKYRCAPGTYVSYIDGVRQCRKK